MKIIKLLSLCTLFVFTGCEITPTTDTKETEKQNVLTAQAAAQVGMPSITRFTEKKMVRYLYELRDDPNLINYCYTFSEVTGKMTLIGRCIGYGIPYSTQFSNPEKDIYATTSSSVHHNLPQSEPNGLFMPTSAEGTWIMLINPQTQKPTAVYIEPKVIVSPFPLQ